MYISTSGSPLILIRIEIIPASRDVDAIFSQLTSDIKAAVPIPASAASATVLIALTVAALSQMPPMLLSTS